MCKQITCESIDATILRSMSPWCDRYPSSRNIWRSCKKMNRSRPKTASRTRIGEILMKTKSHLNEDVTCHTFIQLLSQGIKLLLVLQPSRKVWIKRKVRWEETKMKNILAQWSLHLRWWGNVTPWSESTLEDAAWASSHSFKRSSLESEVKGLCQHDSPLNQLQDQLRSTGRIWESLHWIDF